jgi:hypothetical protein
MVLHNVETSYYPKPYMSKHFRLTSREFGKPKRPKNYKKALDRAKRAVLSPFLHTFFDLPCSRRRRIRTT